MNLSPTCLFPSGGGGGIADGVLEEVSNGIHCNLQLWDRSLTLRRNYRWSFEGNLVRKMFLKDSRCTKKNLSFVYKKRNGFVCGRIDHSRVTPGPFRIINGVLPVFRVLRSTGFHCDL